MACAVRFSSRIKELRIHLCQKGESSKGVREFIQENYVALKTNHPKLPILVRECSYVEPQLWVRFEKGKECRVPLKHCPPAEILTKLENVTADKECKQETK